MINDNIFILGWSNSLKYHKISPKTNIIHLWYCSFSFSTGANTGVREDASLPFYTNCNIRPEATGHVSKKGRALWVRDCQPVTVLPEGSVPTRDTPTFSWVRVTSGQQCRPRPLLQTFCNAIGGGVPDQLLTGCHQNKVSERILIGFIYYIKQIVSVMNLLVHYIIIL